MCAETSSDVRVTRSPRIRPLVTAAVVLGLGLGGFLDGIILHQVLQWHHLTSAFTSDVGTNVFWDGVFHLATLALTVLGIGLLWRAWGHPSVPRSGRVLAGGVLVGWGLFNVTDSLVFHWLLAAHHIWPDGPGGALAWDLAFLALGVLFLVIGWGLVRTSAAYGEATGRGSTAGGRVTR